MKGDTVLQKEVTLNEALLAMSTFRNGCDFKLRFDGEKVYLKYGCYCLINLKTGKPKLLLKFIEEYGSAVEDEVEINPEYNVLMELRKRKPCRHCGGFEYEKQEEP